MAHLLSDLRRRFRHGFVELRALLIGHLLANRERVRLLLRPLTLVLFSRQRVHTKALQEHWRKPEPICAIVRVFVAAPIQGEADKIEATDLQDGGHIVRPRPLGPPKWSGFEFITAKPSGEAAAGRPKLHPWCLLVEEIGSVNAEHR